MTSSGSRPTRRRALLSPRRVRHSSDQAGGAAAPSRRVWVAAAVAVVAVPALGAAGAAPPPSLQPLTLAQARPRPVLCPSPAPAVTANGVLLAPPRPATNPLAPTGVQLWAGSPTRQPIGGPAPLPSSEYAYIVTRTLSHSDFVRWDSRSGTSYRPLVQADAVRWTPADGPTVGYLRYTRSPRRVRGGPIWFTEPAIPADMPNRSDASTPDPPQPGLAASPAHPAQPGQPGQPAQSEWSADAATFAAQIAARFPERRATYVLQAIASRYTRFLPAPAQHTAALTVLCNTPGVRLAGRVVDQAGRPGIAVRAEYEHGEGIVERGLLILDPRTWRPQSWTITWTGRGTAFNDDRSVLLMDAGYRTVLAAPTPP